MPTIKVKKAGAYVDPIGVFTKKGGVYSAMTGLSVKLAGSYGDALARWKAGGVSGKKIAFWGDSTTELASTQFDILSRETVLALGPLAGVVVSNQGHNGQTMLGAISDTSALYATNANLVVLCFGINDVRQGGVDAVAMAARITTAVQGIKTNLPNADILLWTPNSLLSTDSTGLQIIPIASAQAYTDVMWTAYESLRGKFTNTASLDKMAVFGRTCIPTSPLMDDCLHPNSTGQKAALAPLIALLTPPVVPINLTASAAAWTSNPNNPWTVYARALEDTRYCTLIRDFNIGTYLDLSGNLLMYWGVRQFDPNPVLDPATFLNGDFIQTANGFYTKSGGDYTVYNTNSVQVYNIPTSSFPVVPAPSNGRHYRRLP